MRERAPASPELSNQLHRQLDVDDLLARQPFGPRQLLIVAICALAAVVDGADRQAIGLVAVNLTRELNLSATQLGFVFSLDNLGAVVGAILAGQLSDRHGRKPVMAVTLAIVAVATLFTAHAGSYPVLMATRFVAGLGLGGAVPAFLTLAGEYVSKPHRGTVAALMFAGYPIGAACGGLWTNYLLRYSTWPSVFHVGAVLAALVLAATGLVSESIHYLARTPGQSGRAVATAKRIWPDLRGQTFQLVEPTASQRAPAGSPRELFANGLAPATTCLLGVFFFLFATLNVVVNWLPSILTRGGIPQASVALVLTAWNVGSVCGQVTSSRLTAAWGWRRVLVPCLALAAAALAFLGEFSASLGVVLAVILLAGYGVGVPVAGVIGTTATIYATEQRGTALGAGMAVSRVGQLLSPLLIAVLIDMAVGTGAILGVVAALPLAAAVLVTVFATLRRTRPA